MTALPPSPPVPPLSAAAGAATRRRLLPPPQGDVRVGAVVWALIALIALPELVLDLADAGLVGSPGWRPLAYQYGAFWTGLLHDWQPNFALQPLTMFASYALLHGGLMHMLSNAVTLLAFGTLVCAREGPRKFVLIYVAGMLGGAAGFGLLASSAHPMVGASGALFGLGGAWLCAARADRLATGASQRPVWSALAGLAALNLVMWLALSGLLAWQTHLGGFAAGWLTQTLLMRAARAR